VWLHTYNFDFILIEQLSNMSLSLSSVLVVVSLSLILACTTCLPKIKVTMVAIYHLEGANQVRWSVSTRHHDVMVVL
jgi:hypothetical protein